MQHLGWLADSWIPPPVYRSKLVIFIIRWKDSIYSSLKHEVHTSMVFRFWSIQALNLESNLSMTERPFILWNGNSHRVDASNEVLNRSIPIPLALERLDSKDNHRPAQCRRLDRSLNPSDTIVTRWMRTDKGSCIAGQIIVAAAISLRNLSNTRGQASPIERESLELFIRQLFPFLPSTEFLLSNFSNNSPRSVTTIGRDHFLLVSQLIHQRALLYIFSSDNVAAYYCIPFYIVCLIS